MTTNQTTSYISIRQWIQNKARCMGYAHYMAGKPFLDFDDKDFAWNYESGRLLAAWAKVNGVTDPKLTVTWLYRDKTAHVLNTFEEEYRRDI